jgi:hypothetical protein
MHDDLIHDFPYYVDNIVDELCIAKRLMELLYLYDYQPAGIAIRLSQKNAGKSLVNASKSLVYPV